jgi:hypothetical protein
VSRTDHLDCTQSDEVFAMPTFNTHEAPTDRALAILAFAIYHPLESGTRVSSVVADDHAGHRADPSGVKELVRVDFEG